MPRVTIAATEDLEPGEWRLAHKTDRDSGDWRNVTLFRPKEAKKRRERGKTGKYELGWNVVEQRLAGGNETARLKKRHPKMLEWVQERLIAYFG